jgi:hypothetical protein
MISMTIQTPQGPQLTIAGLVAALDALPGGILVKLAGFGSDIAPMELQRHNQNTQDVTILGRYERMSWMTVDRFKVMLIQHATQQATKFNPNPTTLDAPLWAGRTSGHRLEFQAVTGVEVIDDTAYLRWVDVAPVQGPSPQRITDEEVLRRNAELAGRYDANLDPSSDGNRWMLQQIPKERDRARVRLTETQDAIASLLREADGLEAELGRYDYVLGLTDVNPGPPDRTRP